MSVVLRPGTDADGPAMTALIAGCWDEYPGCVMDAAENPHLACPATWFGARGGMLAIAEDGAGGMLGCVSALAVGADAGADAETIELKGLYVRADARGTGVARLLLAAVEDFSRARRAGRLVLWSDTRFARAHRFYERHGFVADGAIRALGDLSNSLEYPYEKPLGRIATRRLAADAARSAMRPLASLLGASDAPNLLRVSAAEAALRERVARLGEPGRAVFAGWTSGVLAGFAAVAPAPWPAGRHAGRIELLVVHPAFSGVGLGGALLAAVEAAAGSLGYAMLVAEMPSDGRADEAVARGWRDVGRIPGYAGRAPDAMLDVTLLRWSAPGT